jgi:hypothetical protein
MPFPYHHEPSNLVRGLLAKCVIRYNRNIICDIASKLWPQHTEDHTAFEEAIARTPNLEAFRYVS